MRLTQAQAELNEKRDAYHRTARSILDKAKNEGRPLSTQERSDVEGLLKKIDGVSADFDLAGKLDTIEARWNETREDQKTKRPGAPATTHSGASLISEGGTRGFGDFLQRVAQAGVPGGHVDVDLQQRSITGMGEAVGSEGGFLVGTAQSTDLLEPVFAGGAIASRIRRLPSLSNAVNSVKIPYVSETSRANGSRLGGVQMFWSSEAAQITSSKPAIGQLELTLNKLTGLCYATDELLQDQALLGAVITDSFRKEMVFAIEDSFFRGTGAGRPLGFMNSSAKISVAKESAQPAATITFNNVATMLSRLTPASMANAVWLTNVSVMPQLLALNVPTKNVAQTENVGGSGAGLIYDVTNQKLLGKPVIFCEYAEALGTEGDIVLCDPNEYLWIDRQMQSASSIHVRFEYAETAFRFVYRCDGQPAVKTALQPYKGSSTTSPFITLATRA